MPGNYKRTSTRKSWSQEDMNKAIEAVKENRMGWLLASKHFNVPQATLRRHFYSTPVNLGRFKPTFDAGMEKVLVDHMLEFESRLFGFNTTDIRKLAFEFAERLGLEHRFDKNKKIAGWDWLKGFRERNPQISLRAPEPTSAARAKAFNKPQVMKFFSLLEKTVAENGIQAHRIYNMDESGLTTVQKPPKVFASKGKKQVGAVTSDERGQHFTVVVCANAIGNFVPPAIIIPRKNHKAEYFDGAPPGTLELCNPSGYMIGDLFVKWMRHFVAFVNASVTNKVLLILDGHSSHKNLEALEFAKANGVILLCLPPHCTHRMQPTDVSFFGPLKAYYDREIATWMKNHPGRTVGLYQVAQIFGKAYENAATVRNITSGFEKTGICPFDPHIFPDDMYLPSEVTENEINNDEPIASSSLSHQNLDESNSSESTDAEEQLTYLAADNPHGQILEAFGEVETRHSSPTILSPNFDTHLFLNITAAPNKAAFPQEAEYSPLSLKKLSVNVVMNSLQDHDVNILSQGRKAMLLDSDSNNAKEQINVIAPKNSYQGQIGNKEAVPVTLCENNIQSLDPNQISGHLLLQPDIISTSNNFATNSILKEISPLPKVASSGKLRVKRKVGGSQVFTASPFMNEIKAAAQLKKEKENRTALKQKQTKRTLFDDSVKSKPTVKKSRIRRGPKKTKSIVLDDDKYLETDNSIEAESAPKKRRSTRSRKQRVKFNDDEDLEDPYASGDEGEDDAACIYCNGLFSQSKPNEHWVKCQLCSNWSHTLCAGISAKTKTFICELCA